MNLPLCDIRASDAPYRDEIDDAIKRVIDNSSFILGKEVESFEENFARYIGVKHCIGVSSCTAALHLALKCFNYEDGEIKIPVRTVTADVEAVKLLGMHYSFYDKRLYDNGEDFDAYIVVHLYGMPNDRVLNFDNEEDRCLIEDCAQATGAEINGRKVGTFGDISCFSFFPSKPLGCYGDGGAVCTNNDGYAERIRALRNHGRKQGEKHKHDLAGYNYRLDGLQAAILNVKLKHLDNCIKRRRHVSKLYERWLEDVEEIKIPIEPPNCKSVYYTYTIEAQHRDKLREHLKNNGIQTGLHYPIPLHKQPPYAKPEYNFPEADVWAERTLSLPMYPALEEETIKYISDKVREFYAG